MQMCFAILCLLVSRYSIINSCWLAELNMDVNIAGFEILKKKTGFANVVLKRKHIQHLFGLHQKHSAFGLRHRMLT